MSGDFDSNTVEFSAMSRWRGALEKKHGRGVAHKTLRVWRSLWTIMEGMKTTVPIRPVASGIAPLIPVTSDGNDLPGLRTHYIWTEHG
jgi:hypothetical protein